MEDRYLGDGVYAKYDGFSIVLDLRCQDMSVTKSIICLEPQVMDALFQFRGDIEKENTTNEIPKT